MPSGRRGRRGGAVGGGPPSAIRRTSRSRRCAASSRPDATSRGPTGATAPVPCTAVSSSSPAARPARPAPSAAPVAFGLTTPLLAGLRRVVRRPGRTLPPVLLLLLPLVPVAVAVVAVLRAGADVALTALLAGAPSGAEGAVIVRPDGFGVRMLVLLAALLVVAAAVVAAAGLAAGAAATGARSAGAAVRGALRVWPGVALVVIAGALLAGVLAAAVVAVALLAGELRFQLTGVVLLAGLGALAVALVRLSLWPAVARDEGLAARVALRRAWALTGGDVVRLTLAALVALVALALPAGVLWLAITAVLDALADAETLELSPVAIGLWALLPVPFTVVLGAAVWGIGARTVAGALRDRAEHPED